MVEEKTFRPAEQVRRFVRGRGGRARLADLYEHLGSEAAARTIRQVDFTVENLVQRGELKVEGLELVFLGLKKQVGQESEAHGRLWRAAHQRTGRGGFGSADLASLGRVRPDSAIEWVRAMREQGFLRETGREGSRRIYRLTPGAPGPDNPPDFRWPRRGIAKTSRDIPL